ncbi:MAG: peptidoglycan D,D-transpeptidase FtsI family protein [Solirubrobacteraceae bacterium]
MARTDRRIGLLFALFMALLCAAVARASYLGLVKSSSLQAAARTEQVELLTTPALRGEITDRHGLVLALSESTDEVIADPHLIKHPLVVASRIAPLLGVSESTIYAGLTKRHTGYVPLAFGLPAAKATLIRNMTINGLPINGLSFDQVENRVYPHSTMAAQVLGWVGHYGTASNGEQSIFKPDGIGEGGLEYLYNKDLSGRDGLQRIVNDGDAQPIAVDQLRPTVPGKTITMTIDSALQTEVEQVLAGVGAEYSPQSATAIVMNPDNGEILALANWPFVNSNDVSAAPLTDTSDQAVAFSYEPGSTFKAITVAGALQDGTVTPSTIFDIPPDLQVGGYTISDNEAHGYEELSVADILKVSSNIGADRIAATLGPKRFDYWVHAFGFGEPTGVDLPGEQPGIVLHWQQYSGTSMFNLPFGQGESVTPMQMAAAYSAVANGGVLRAPRIVQAIDGVPTKLPAGRRVISPTTAAELREMLRGVLADGGTASGAAIDGYDLAGKTGTAQIATDGRYSDTQFVASFIGMVPASDPKLVVAVVVDQPQGSIYGGSVAAPAFQRIVGWAVPYFGINPCPVTCPPPSSYTVP